MYAREVLACYLKMSSLHSRVLLMIIMNNSNNNNCSIDLCLQINWSILFRWKQSKITLLNVLCPTILSRARSSAVLRRTETKAARGEEKRKGAGDVGKTQSHTHSSSSSLSFSQCKYHLHQMSGGTGCFCITSQTPLVSLLADIDVLLFLLACFVLF